MSMPIKSPLRWVGGKSAEAERLASLLPTHSCYVEPFGGGASVLLSKPPSSVEIYNDLDGELTNFWRVIKETPSDFIASWEWTLSNRTEFEELCNTDPQSLSPVRRAYRFLYLNRVGFGGDMSRKPRWGGNTLRRSNLAMWLERHMEWIPSLYDRLMSVTIECRDGREVIKRYDSPSTAFFIDPPYRTEQGYKHSFSDDDHEELAGVLKTTKAKWLMTINDDPYITKLYSWAHITPRSKLWGLSKTDGQAERYPELLITNFDDTPRTQTQTLFALEPQPNKEVTP